PDQERLVSIFYNAGENLLALINDILDISKIEAREIHIENIPLDLPALVKNVHDLMQLRAESKGLELKLKVHPEINVGIKGDPTRLRQVIMNLVGNAIKFTEKGYVQITVDFADDLKKELIFSVKDTGLGIPKDKHSILFNSFVQADSSITRKFGGTGLGLVISKNLAHLMGGKIWFESDAGKGSTFSFTIPYAPVAESEIKALYGEQTVAPSQPIEDIKPMTVLIVDDSEDNRFLLINYLKKVPQLKVIQAENGVEAFASFKENDLDLILMDIQMPEMDGYQAGALIRAWEADHHKKPIPMIALSANAMLEDIQKSLQNGFNQHVSKPVKRDVIIAVIQQYANGSAEPKPHKAA
ncbi:MAG TPA: ATP-binding protein, partial [Pseudobdellovibrionaceae bacterium]|nr:ATP-binding protein [Pseudobdellovibrionaceae bacterium]